MSIFFERSLQLLSNGGVLSFITSNKYFRSGYGHRLRAYLSYATSPRVILDFGDAPVFTSIAYPAILVTQKTRHVTKGKLSLALGPKGALDSRHLPPEDRRFQGLTWSPGPAVDTFPGIFEAQSIALPQRELKPDSWRIESPVILRLLERLRAAGTPLGEYVQGRFYRGITTGLNEAFVVDRRTRDRLIAEHPSSQEVLKPFLRGRDVKRWRCEPQDLWLVFTRRGIDMTRYPAIHEHLKTFKKALTPGIPGGRKPGSYQWYEIQDNIAYWQEFEEPKVIFGRFMDKATYAYDDERLYHNDALYFASRVTPFVTAIVNSPVNWWFLMQTCTDLQNGYLQALRQYQEAIPIPYASLAQQTLCERVARTLIWLHRRDTKNLIDNSAGLMVAYLEQWLNGLVYELFFPDELQARNLHLFDETARLNPPDLEKLREDQKAEAIQELFAKAYDANATLRAMLFDLRSLDVARIIEEESPASKANPPREGNQ
jgi:adenine-specific DNA-methyltransferase